MDLTKTVRLGNFVLPKPKQFVMGPCPKTIQEWIGHQTNPDDFEEIGSIVIGRHVHVILKTEAHGSLINNWLDQADTIKQLGGIVSIHFC